MRYLLISFVFVFSVKSFAATETFGNGRGGFFVDGHVTNASVFDSSLNGTPIVVGGEGIVSMGKGLRFGGGGGAGFLFNPNGITTYSLGYGGVIGEYLANTWLSVRVLVGGGGYAVAKQGPNVLGTNEFPIAGGGFFLFQPSVGVEIPFSSMVRGTVRAGYFITSVSNLQSWTLGFSILFGKN